MVPTKLIETCQNGMESAGQAWFKDNFIVMAVFLLGAAFSGLVGVIEIIDKCIKNEQINSIVAIAACAVFGFFIVLILVAITCRLLAKSVWSPRLP